tara:strand:+ start:93 stop:290 length:198 start_codon:yes stop_codon:yes gene_type:complete
MNKFKQILGSISENKVAIIKNTLIVTAAIVGVTVAAGLVKIGASDKATEVIETAAKAVKKAADKV